jgi:dTDP-4-amino-4,6-dideoxygalactose transaminase
MSVLLPKGVKAAVIAKKLDRAGIETRRWYSPGLHLHPALANTLRTGVLTIADDVGERILGLPFFIGLTEAQLEYIGHSLAAALD